MFSEQFHRGPCCVGRGSVLLKPHIPVVHFFQMWKEKFFDHLPVWSCIHRDSALVFLKKIRTNDLDRRKCAPNLNTLKMERGLVKLTWIFSTPVAHVLFVDIVGKVKGEMERPLLKYASTANARCALVQSMIGTRGSKPNRKNWGQMLHFPIARRRYCRYTCLSSDSFSLSLLSPTTCSMLAQLLAQLFSMLQVVGKNTRIPGRSTAMVGVRQKIKAAVFCAVKCA